MRRAEQGRQLSKLFPLNFEYVVVPDIAAVSFASAALDVASAWLFLILNPANARCGCLPPSAWVLSPSRERCLFNLARGLAFPFRLPRSSERAD